MIATLFIYYLNLVNPQLKMCYKMTPVHKIQHLEFLLTLFLFSHELHLARSVFISVQRNDHHFYYETIDGIRSSILRNHKTCQGLDLVWTEMRKREPANNNTSQFHSSPIPTKNSVEETNIIFNNSQQSQKVQSQFSSLDFPIKLSQRCLFILIFMTVDNPGNPKREFEFDLQTEEIPGRVNSNSHFYAIFIQQHEKLPSKSFHSSISSTNSKTNLANVVGEKRVVKKILNVILVLDNQFFLFRSHGNQFSSIAISKTETGDIFPKPGRRNWEGADFLLMTCAVCEKYLKYFKKTGRWNDFIMASIYHVSSRLNATFTIEPVFSPPKNEPNDDGTWDGLRSPLMDGRAMMSGPTIPSAKSLGVIFITRPIISDRMIFIAAKPKAEEFRSFAIFLRPLSSDIWLQTLLCVLLIFLLFQGIVWSYKMRPGKKLNGVEQVIMKNSNSKPSNILIFLALLLPFIGQNGWTDKMSGYFTQVKGILDISRLMVSFWFLALLVLSNGYQSALTALVVTPEYVSAPTNFHDLFKSDYQLAASFFYGPKMDTLKELAGNLKDKIQITEHVYYKPDCYQLIFSKKAVCIGYKTMQEIFGLEFMVDVHGQKMFVESTDSHFWLTTGLSISKDYPEILEVANARLGELESSGFMFFWSKSWKKSLIKKGRANARRFVGNKTYYKGDSFSGGDGQKHTIGRQLAFLAIKLFFWGVAGAFLGFLTELLLKFWKKRRKNELIWDNERVKGDWFGA